MKMYSPKELAKQTGVAEVKIRKWIKTGELSVHNMSDTLNPRYKISERSWQSFLESRSVITVERKRKRRTDVPSRY